MSDIKIIAVEEELDGLVYRGTLYRPAEPGPWPTVVLHHGFGSLRQEVAGLFVRLSRELASQGFLAIAFDRAGHGESDGSYFDTTVSGDIETAKRLLERIVARPEVDGERVHLLGMSLGSVVCSVVAAETPLPIASLTLWSPAAVFVDDANSGFLQDRPIAVVQTQGYFDNGGLRLGPAFFEDARTFDVYGRPGAYSGPVRVIHGDQDVIVPTEYALRYAEVFGDAVAITIVPGADHVWSAVRVRDQLIDETVAFLRSRSE